MNISDAIDTSARVLAIVTPIIVALAPIVVPAVLGRLPVQRQRRFVKAARAATVIAGELAKRAPATTVDDSLLRILRSVSDEMGRNLSEAEIIRATAIAGEMHADPTVPVSLGQGVAAAAIEQVRAQLVRK